MKRGKRFIEDNNIYIYLGTVIFFVLAIALGIIMYMLSRTATKIQNNEGQVAQEQLIGENIEDVATDIGKTVEESENETKSTNTETNIDNNVETEKVSEKTNDTKTSDTEAGDKTEKKVISSSEQSQKESEIVKQEITFIKPTEGEIICEYAKDNLIYSETLKEWITHTAIDIKADKTSVIKSSADGIVRSIINDPRYGLTVVIEHDDGYETIYSNLLTAEFVVEGEEVTQGQTIGTAGNTASFESGMESHLHFELLKDGEYLDPSIYLK